MNRLVVLPVTVLIACGGKTTSTTTSDESSRGASVGDSGEPDAASMGGADAAGSDGGGGPTGAGAGGASCMNGAECASGICFVGGSRSFCSLRCTPATAPTACAGPFEGRCNEMGYCRLPGGP